MKTPSMPQEQRAQDVQFVAACSLAGLQGRLPLRWPTPPGTRPSPKKRYRSRYVYLGWEGLADPTTWEEIPTFDLLLRLVDFSGVRPVLAQLLGWTSGRGWCPFDPVSLFLLLGWQIVNRWSRAETLRNLQQPRYADYVRRFGFQAGVYPSEGGLRYFLTALGSNSEMGGEVVTVEQGDQIVAVAVQRLNQLLAQAVHLIREAGVLSEAAWEAALLCPDGQLHAAASRLRCQAVGATCYQATMVERPRPCAAREKGQRGCDCATQPCAQICKRATPRDPQARFVWYTGRNPDAGEAGEAHYGYRSLPLQLADRERRFSLTLLSDVRPANQREEVPAAALLLQLGDHYPDLQVDTVAGDAGVGSEVFLRTVYEHLGARRVVDLRGHESDRDEQGWVLRGYDDQGRPLCEYGYTLRANGYDRERRRHKWVCQQACLQGREPQVHLPQVTYPPPECPYQAPQHRHGKVVNVGACFPDGSWRLVRDVPVGSPTWKALYHRGRNAVESRNATLEDWGLKRLPVYGLPRSKALLFLADVWANLTTLARLVQEATLASSKS
jgi:hypothetical protein